MVKVQISLLVCAVLLIMACPPGRSRECKQVPLQQRRMNKEALKLLGKMREIPHPDCPQERTTFSFPVPLTKVPEEVLQTVLHRTSQFLAHAMESITWDEPAAGATHQLQMLLRNMSQRWVDCLYKEMISAPTKPGKHAKNYRKIKNYFRRMTNFLNAKGYSRCAWTVARSEVENIMQFVTRHTDILLKSKTRRKPRPRQGH